MYYPDKFLPIFSEEHYDYLLNKLGIMNNSIKGIIYKQAILIEYKNNIEELNILSNYEFVQFLYYLYGRNDYVIKVLSIRLMAEY
ncbi:hypothetical protein BUY81_13320 [Staphylococcus equorum]|nr:hypothetical protein BUY81_13320 [Staphylococcus equorum]